MKKTIATIGGGMKPCHVDHRDYDFHRTFGTAGQTPVFPPELILDAGLWMPNQNTHEPIFDNPPMPFGCTDYITSDLSADQDGKLYNPMYIENYYHANAAGGGDVRTSLMVSVKQGTQALDKTIRYRTSLFSIKAYAPLDYFDAIRYAMLSGGVEKRSVSWGCPWFPSWQTAIMRGETVMPMPTDEELANVRKVVSLFGSFAFLFGPSSNSGQNIGWHNSKFAGFKNVNGIPMLINKSLQGENIGDKGFIYFPREVVNMVMSIRGTCAFTVTSMGSGQPIQRVSTTVLQWIVSNIKNFLGLRY